MWEFFWARAVITSPKQERDLLIYWASFSLSPVTSDLSTRSLPARSTKCKQLRMELPDVSLPWTCTVSTLKHVDQPCQCLKQPQILHIRKAEIHLWERLLLLFIAVKLTARLISPSFMRVITSVVDFTGRNLASGRLNPSSLQLRISIVRSS